MDVILTPTKLNGTIQSRPSAISVFLHETAQKVATLHGEHAGAIQPVCTSTDLLSRGEVTAEDMDGISGCLQAMGTDTDRLDCGKSLKALHLAMPIAAATIGRITFVGDPSLCEEAIAPEADILTRHGVAFSQEK